MFTIPQIAHANLVWPALLMESKLHTPGLIIFGLLIEFFVIRKITKYSVLKSAIITFIMNLVSVVAGLIVIFWLSLWWESVIGYVIPNAHTFHPINWAITVISIPVINTLLEWPVIRLLFKTRIGKKGFLFLMMANFASSIIAYISLLFFSTM